MIENLKKMLSEIEEAITYAIETDTAYTREFSKLVKQKRILKKAIRKMEKAIKIAARLCGMEVKEYLNERKQ